LKNKLEAFLELEQEIKQEFFADVQSCIDDINQCIESLEDGSSDDVINRMYRALHTVKGNCRMVFLDDFVEASHKIEELFSDVRNGKINYHPAVGHLAVVAVNQLNKHLEHLLSNGSYDDEQLKKLESLVESVGTYDDAGIAEQAEKARMAIIDGHYNPELVAVESDRGYAFSFINATDIEFFQFLIDTRIQSDPKDKFIFDTVMALATRLNNKLNQQLDKQQLQAAVIMLTLALSWRGEASYQQAQLDLQHVYYACGLLQRIAGWSQAAEVIFQVLERHDGQGLPNGLSDKEIQPAAQVLNLAFHFALTALKHLSDGYKVSLFSAVKSINSMRESVYRPRLIERFNQVIKEDYLSNPRW